jgi:hypothetical protein
MKNMTTHPKLSVTREELLELLEEIIPAFENMLIHHGKNMPRADQLSREESLSKGKRLLAKAKFDFPSLSGWAIASLLGCHYSGDGSPVNGGVFFDSTDWEKYGYATAVQIGPEGEDRSKVTVTIGTISATDNETIFAAWLQNHSDPELLLSIAESNESKVIAQILAAWEHNGIEPRSEDAFFDIEKDDEYALAEIVMTEINSWAEGTQT